jgi:hypothetical protein
VWLDQKWGREVTLRRVNPTKTDQNFAGQLADSTIGAKHQPRLESLKRNMKRSLVIHSPDSTDKVCRSTEVSGSSMGGSQTAAIELSVVH